MQGRIVTTFEIVVNSMFAGSTPTAAVAVLAVSASFRSVKKEKPSMHSLVDVLGQVQLRLSP